jgi:sugar O-acyltransferase (sialic acid O-acetyltransferase NeuD family)
MFILGAGGHAASCADLIIKLGYEILGTISPSPPSSSLLSSYPHYPDINCIATLGLDQHFCVAIGDNYTRQKVIEDLIARHGESSLPALIHPSSSVSHSAVLSMATVVFPGSVIGAGVSIGEGCLINTGALIDHESSLESFSSVAPGVCMGGNVRVGYRSAVCLGANVVHGISIGRDSVVGAGSLVLNDIGDLAVWYGSPACYVRPRKPFEKYL